MNAITPRLAVDGVLLVEGRLVTILRGKSPFQGMHALPGGLVELGEAAEAAVLREVEEETGLITKVDRLVGVYSNPGRDPRGHTVGIAYALRRIGGRLQAGSDAAAIELLNPRHLLPMAFDHADIVRDFLAGGGGLPRDPRRDPATRASHDREPSRSRGGGSKRRRTARTRRS